MSIISIEFFIFLAIAALAYYLVPKRFQWGLLLIASVVFYLFSSVVGLCVMAFTTLIAYLAARYMGAMHVRRDAELNVEGLAAGDKKAIKRGYKSKCKRIMLYGLIVVVLVLLALKYFNFFSVNVSSLLNVFGVQFAPPVLNWMLPLGISFYTMTTLGYIIDVYREKAVAERNFFKLALFVCYFPQITQGPISRYAELAPALCEPRSFDYTRVTQALQLMLWGFFKKLVLADNLGVLVDKVYGSYAQAGGLDLIIATIAFSIQIYADFSGFMDIVTGASELFGIPLAENFKRPYFSRTMPEFWRRWHITLGQWFKDYVFYPVSASRAAQRLNKGARKLFGHTAGRLIAGCLPIFCVWMLTGFWHGASWKFVVWGLYHGVLIMLSLIFTPPLDKLSAKLKLNRKRWPFIGWQMIRTFALCCVGRVFFRATELGEAVAIFNRMGATVLKGVRVSGVDLGLTEIQLGIVIGACVLLLIASIIQERGHRVRDLIATKPIAVRFMIFYAVIVIVLLCGNYKVVDGPFIYQQF